MKTKPLRFAVALLAETIWLSGCETKQQAASGPTPVEFIEVIQKDVPVSKEWWPPWMVLSMLRFARR